MAGATASGSSIWWLETREWMTWGEGVEREELRTEAGPQVCYKKDMLRRSRQR